MNKEAIELLVEAIVRGTHYPNEKPFDRVELDRDLYNQALTLLKQPPEPCKTCDGYGKRNKHNYSTGRMDAIPCETCGGTGKVKCKCCDTYVCRMDDELNPCPDCKPEPSEFVKDIRAIILKRSRNSVDRRELDDNKILLACNTIDHQAEEIKAQNEMLSQGAATIRILTKRHKLDQGEIKRLKEALEKYGRHGICDGPMCEMMKHSDYDCTCGFEEVLKKS